MADEADMRNELTDLQARADQVADEVRRDACVHAHMPQRTHTRTHARTHSRTKTGLGFTLKAKICKFRMVHCFRTSRYSWTVQNHKMNTLHL